MFLDYSLCFWYGSKLIDDHTHNSTMGRVYTSGDILVIFFAIMIGKNVFSRNITVLIGSFVGSLIIGGFSLGQLGPCLKNFAIGQQAGRKVFDILERKPLITLPENA